jgi:hypothetical protein
MDSACSGKNGDIERLRQQANEATHEARHVRAAGTPATQG